MSDWKARAELWEDDEYIVVLRDLGPTGMTLSKDDARVVVRWLQDRAGLHDLFKEIESLRAQLAADPERERLIRAVVRSADNTENAMYEDLMEMAVVALGQYERSKGRG